MTTSSHLWARHVHQQQQQQQQQKRRVSTVHVCMAAITLAFMGGIAVAINGWLMTSPMREASNVFFRWNVSSSTFEKKDGGGGGDGQNGRRRMAVDLTLPAAIISHKRQEVRGERKEPVYVAAVTAGLPQITRPYALGMPSEWRSHNGVPATILAAVEKQEQEQVTSNMSVEQRQNGGGGLLHDLVDGGVFWSESVESMLPAGFNEDDVTSWTEFSSNTTVVKVLDGCGRMQNRMLVFENGTKSCCRYRQNNDQIQGEIFSFYLAKLLGLRNLPPASLGLLYGREWQWTSVRGQLTLAQWSEQKPVVMTKFVDGLEPAFIPRNFRGDVNEEALNRRLHPVVEDLVGLDRNRLIELAQWSDLIVFDYLTANLDRVVNNMYNRQWNPDMMVAPAHNLAKETHTGLLVFLDNESGLLHGYRLLDKYESYHRSMLQSLCVFRARTVRAIRTLMEAGDVGPRLRRTLHESQSYMTEWLPPLPDKSVKILRKRLEAVDRQVTLCERRYNPPGSEVSGTVERYDSPVTPVTS